MKNCAQMKSLNILIIMLLLLITGKVSAQKGQDQLKSVFIYNFIKYVDWPGDYKNGDFVITTLGKSSTVAKLQEVAQRKRAGSQKIVVNVVNSVGEIPRTHILYIPKSRSNDLAAAKRKLGKQSTLIITENEGLAHQGACINFVYRDAQQQFELNKKAIENQGLQVSTNLVNLSIQVE